MNSFHKHALILKAFTRWKFSHNAIFLSSAPLIMSSRKLMIFTFYTQQRGMPFCRQSLTGYNTRQKHSRLCCTLSFFPPPKKEEKGKMGQQQLNNQNPGFVKAEEVCSWEHRGRRRRLFFSQTTKTPHPRLHFFASLQPEDADQD